MSALDRIRELEAEREKLLKEAKQEALQRAEDAVKTLNELGFNYQLIEGDKPKQARRPRKSGVRDAVLAEIKKHPNGISRAELLEAMNATDASAQQSVSNAVAALKKNDLITAEQGHYTANG